MSSASNLFVALSVCACAHSSPSGGAAPTGQVSTPPPGRIATEIDPRIWVVHQAGNGDYWFGSNGNGAYRYDGQRITQFNDADGLADLQVRDIQEDAEGNILIATVSGVSKLDDKGLTPLEIVEPPTGSDGWELNPDDRWIRFDPGGYGTLRYDGEKLYHLKLSKSPTEDAHRARYADAPVFFSPSSVYSTYKDRSGHVWFGTASLGLCRYDGQTLSWMYEEHLTTTPSGGAFGIRSVYEDREGNFWICNTRHRFEISSEVANRDGYSFLQYEKKEGLPDAKTNEDQNFTFYPSMTEDEAGALWMACGSSVLKYDGNDVAHYPIVEGAYAAAILCDKAGKMWVGTIEHGIYTLEAERFEPFNPN